MLDGQAILDCRASHIVSPIGIFVIFPFLNIPMTTDVELTGFKETCEQAFHCPR